MGDRSKIEQILAQICRITKALGVDPLNQYPGVWEHKIDEQWFLAINPHDVKLPRRTIDEDVQPYHFIIDYNEWPFAMFNIYDGFMGNGLEANGGTLLAALKAHADELEVGA